MSGMEKYLKLTPNAGIDISSYDEAFNYAFQNSDIRNIAITGSYGSGKSSLIESYKKKHGEKHSFMQISLARFHGNDEESTQDSEKESSGTKLSVEAILEGKVINQLIHQVPPRKIEQTSFKVKHTIRKRDIILPTAAIVLFILCMGPIFYSEQLVDWIASFSNKAINTALLGHGLWQWIQLISGVTAIALLSYLVYKLVKMQKYKNLFKKINVNGNEIEIFENQDDSYFDKYLNEILYLFENIEQDVVVFEDLDRHDSVEIFERLHEINNLINIKKENKPIRFFYLVRDDIFLSKDRTKFFDFIIPVVPVVDSSNSYTRLSSFLKAGNSANGLDEKFLQSLSLYIDDMRILKNICNEYSIYLVTINTTELNKDKLLAMITYKNMFPGDFSELQFGRGFVHEVISNKNKIRESLVAECDAKIQKLQETLADIQKQTLKSIEELDIVLKYRLETSDPLNKEQIEQEFIERKKALDQNMHVNTKQLETDIRELSDKKAEYAKSLLKDLITSDNVDQVFSATSENLLGELTEYNDIKRSDYFDMLRFLIREGYIDESYCDYMSYFYEGGICTNDKIYLRRITDRRGRVFDYHITNPDAILSSPLIAQERFMQEEMLNFDLLEYLLDNKDKNLDYSNYIDVLIQQIKQNHEFEFLSQFYDNYLNHAAFVNEFNERWSGFFQDIMNDSHFDKQIRSISLETMYYCPDNVIKFVNTDDCLTRYISDNSAYLDIYEPDIEALKRAFHVLNVSFASIDYERSNKKLFEMVYSCGYYDITFDNIRMMLINKYNIYKDYDIKHRMATIILSNADTPLAKRMTEKLTEFVEVIIANCEGVIEDDQNAAITILNSTEVRIALRREYINYLTKKISDLRLIRNAYIFKSLLREKKIEYSVYNIVLCHQFLGMDSALISFFNSPGESVDFSDVSNSFQPNIVDNFFYAVVRCNKLSNEKYESTLLQLGNKISYFREPGINQDKMRVLIDNNIILFNVDNMIFIRDCYRNFRYDFILKNLNQYAELHDQVYDYEETEHLLSLNIDDEIKLKLLDNKNGSYSVIEKGYSDRVMAAIINDHFCEVDARPLFTEYSNYSYIVQEAIFNAALGRVNAIVDYDGLIDLALLLRLLSVDVDFSSKIALFDYSLEFIHENQYKSLLNAMGFGELSEIFKSRSVKEYESSDEIIQILEVLKRHSLIKGYHKTDDDPPTLRIIKARSDSQNNELNTI